MSKLNPGFELCDGRIQVKYDGDTGEILDLCDWNGNEVHERWWRIAEQEIAERMFAHAELVRGDR